MTARVSANLPVDLADQKYVSVKPMIAGTISIPLNFILQDWKDLPDQNAVLVPSFAFLVSHPTRGHVLYDLGVRKNGDGYPPVIDNAVYGIHKAVCDEDVAEQLEKGGVQPEDITGVILSHIHWDHVGDPSLFANAEIVMGSDAQRILEDRVYPANHDGVMQQLPKFNKRTFVDFNSQNSRFKRISPFGTFEEAVDFFGDGSFYVVNTPGHCPGHISAAARVAKDTFVFFAGDLCHHREAYGPERRLIRDRTYEDVDTARDTVRRLANLNKANPGVIVILAHEPERLMEGMPLFPRDLRDWAVAMVEKRKGPMVRL